MRYSYKTGWALLLAMLLWSGIAAWNAWHPDSCYRYMRGDMTQPSSEAVEMSGTTVYVPCSQWYPRQTLYVQTACVAAVVSTAIFLLLLAGDVVNWRRMKMGMRRLEE